MTRSVAAFLHVSSSQSVYDDDRFHTVFSSVNEGESGDKNGVGVIGKMNNNKVVQKVEISSDEEVAGRVSLGRGGEDALDHGGHEEEAQLSTRGCDRSCTGDHPHECVVKRKRACLESSSVDQPWVSSSAEEETPAFGWEHGRTSMEVSVTDAAPREVGGGRSTKSSQDLVGPQANSSHVQHVSQTSAELFSRGQSLCMSCSHCCFVSLLLPSYKTAFANITCLRWSRVVQEVD